MIRVGRVLLVATIGVRRVVVAAAVPCGVRPIAISVREPVVDLRSSPRVRTNADISDTVFSLSRANGINSLCERRDADSVVRD